MLHVTRDQDSTVSFSGLLVEIFCLVIGVMEEQRVVIKFCVKAGKSAVETIFVYIISHLFTYQRLKFG